MPVTLGIVVVTNLLAVFVTLETLSVPFVGVIDVVTKFLPVSAVTDLTKVSEVVFGYPVTAVAVPLAPTAVPLALPLI